MIEQIEIEIAAQLAIDTQQQVFVEFSCYAGSVIVSVEKHLTVFHQIKAYQ